jgi:antitoxin ParD1/3/4
MKMAEKLSITLPAEMVSAINGQVKEGRFASVSEVLREAVRTWMRQEEEHAERIASIRSRIDRSLADPRPRVSLDEAFERLERKHKLVRPATSA